MEKTWTIYLLINSRLKTSIFVVIVLTTPPDNSLRSEWEVEPRNGGLAIKPS